MPPLPGEEHATLNAFFKHSYIEVVPVDRAVAELAVEYAERFGLKNHDAVQLATAVREGKRLPGVGPRFSQERCYG
jgi:predicted nucleic acid-binding protein